MERPEFTSEELFVINYYKARKHLGDTFWADIGYVLPSAIFAGWGIYAENALVAAIGYTILLLFKFREMFYSVKWAKIFGGIFEKYEAALVPTEPSDSEC